MPAWSDVPWIVSNQYRWQGAPRRCTTGPIFLAEREACVTVTSRAPRVSGCSSAANPTREDVVVGDPPEPERWAGIGRCQLPTDTRPPGKEYWRQTQCHRIRVHERRRLVWIGDRPVSWQCRTEQIEGPMKRWFVVKIEQNAPGRNRVLLELQTRRRSSDDVSCGGHVRSLTLLRGDVAQASRFVARTDI